MAQQASKRQRQQKQFQKIRPTIEGRSGTRIDSQYWLYHQVDDTAAAELSQVSEAMNGHAIQPKLGQFTLSLLHPADITVALRQSPLRGYFDARGVYERLPLDDLALPTQAIEVGVKGLQNYGNRSPKIGVAVESPELEQAHGDLMDEIHRFLGTKPQRKTDLHITIARGSLRHLTNSRDVEDLLPPTITVGPLQRYLNVNPR